MNRYNYNDLRAAATSENKTQAEIDALGEWFENYGAQYWNGEYFDADDGLKIAPIIQWDPELEQGKTTGYKFI